MENRIENAAKKAALSIFLSEYPDNAAPDEVIEMVAAQNDRVLFWEPVEDWPGESLADAIRDAAAAILSEWETATTALTQAIAAIREILSADEWSPETLDMIADTVNRIDDTETGQA